MSKTKKPQSTIAGIWERVTGLPWKAAKEIGYTDGSAEQNKRLLSALKSGDIHWQYYQDYNGVMKPTIAWNNVPDDVSEKYIDSDSSYSRNFSKYVESAYERFNSETGSLFPDENLYNKDDVFIYDNGKSYGRRGYTDERGIHHDYPEQTTQEDGLFSYEDPHMYDVEYPSETTDRERIKAEKDIASVMDSYNRGVRDELVQAMNDYLQQYHTEPAEPLINVDRNSVFHGATKAYDQQMYNDPRFGWMKNIDPIRFAVNQVEQWGDRGARYGLNNVLSSNNKQQAILDFFSKGVLPTVLEGAGLGLLGEAPGIMASIGGNTMKKLAGEYLLNTLGVAAGTLAGNVGGANATNNNMKINKDDVLSKLSSEGYTWNNDDEIEIKNWGGNSGNKYMYTVTSRDGFTKTGSPDEPPVHQFNFSASNEMSTWDKIYPLLIAGGASTLLNRWLAIPSGPKGKRYTAEFKAMKDDINKAVRTINEGGEYTKPVSLTAKKGNKTYDFTPEYIDGLKVPRKTENYGRYSFTPNKIRKQQAYNAYVDLSTKLEEVSKAKAEIRQRISDAEEALNHASSNEEKTAIRESIDKLNETLKSGLKVGEETLEPNQFFTRKPYFSPDYGKQTILNALGGKSWYLPIIGTSAAFIGPWAYHQNNGYKINSDMQPNYELQQQDIFEGLSEDEKKTIEELSNTINNDDQPQKTSNGPRTATQTDDNIIKLDVGW